MRSPLRARPFATIVATGALAALLVVMVASSFGDVRVASHGYHHPSYALTLDPAVASRSVGTTHAVTATASSGVFRLSNVAVHYAVTGANPSAGTVFTNGQGQAVIAWTGTRPGDDTLLAYADLDGDDVRDPSDPIAASSVRWEAEPSPDRFIRFPRSNRSITVDREGRFAFAIAGTPGLRGRATFRTTRAVTANGRRLTLGARPFRIPASGRTTVRVLLRRSALVALARRGRFPVRASVRVDDIGSTTYAFTLRARRSR
jgi:hypothetical protein